MLGCVLGCLGRNWGWLVFSAIIGGILGLLALMVFLLAVPPLAQGVMAVIAGIIGGISVQIGICWKECSRP